MNLQKIIEILNNQSEKNYRLQQILNYIFKQRISLFSQMNSLPLRLKNALISELGDSICNLKINKKTSLEQVDKILFSLEDGNCVEAVNLRYKKGWESFCISSQCGCGFACQFCATGTMQLKRNLEVNEILDQLLFFYLLGKDLNSISFMGMGEPLANPNIFNALSLITNPSFFGLSQRKITISTIGIIPNLKRLTNEFPQINIAFSLHSPFQNQRNELMPVNKKYPFYEVFELLDKHIQQNRRKVFIAYIMLKNVNDSLDHAKAIVNLIKARDNAHLYHVDLIPYNNTNKTQAKFEPSTNSQTKMFCDFLRNKGISASVRAQFGSSINAACGQLFN